MTRSKRVAGLVAVLALLAGAVATWAWRRNEPDGRASDDGSANAPAESATKPLREPTLAAPPTKSADSEPASAKRAGTPAATRVEGTVRTREGRPLAQALVRLQPNPTDLWSNERTTTARDDGTFRFDDPPIGAARVFVRGAGWTTVGLQDAEAATPDPLEVKVEREQVSRISLTVVPAARTSGTVVDPAGKPVAGAKVYAFVRAISGDSRPSTFLDSFDERVARPVAVVATDAAGRFALDGLVGGASYDVAATHASFLPAHVGPVVASDAEPRVVTLALREGRWIDVTVVSEEGKPVPEARIWADPADKEANERAEVAQRLARVGASERETDAQGRVRLGPLEPAPMKLATKVAGFLDDWKESAANEAALGEAPRAGAEKPSETVVPVGTDAITLRLRRGLPITGKVVDEHGVPVSGVSVQAQIRIIRPNGHGIRGFEAVRTDAEGRFHLDGMPAGTITLEAKTWTPLRQATKDVEAGVRDVTIVLGADAVAGLEFLIVDADGKAVPRATVIQGGWHSVEARGGRCEFDIDLLFGREKVTIDVVDPRDDAGHALPLARARVVCRRGGPRQITVRLEPEAPIVGRVVGPDDGGVAGVAVTAVVSDDASGDRDEWEFPVKPPAGRTDDGGSFRIGGLPARPYRLRVEAPEPYLTTPAVETRAGGEPVLIRLRRGVVATVTVLDARGEPVAGAYVRSVELDDNPLADVAASLDGAALAGVTSADGTKRLGPLDAERPRRLEVRPPEGRPELRAHTADRWSPHDDVVRLERGQFVRGVVQDKKGVAFANAYVLSFVDDAPGPGAWSDKGGRFVLQDLPQGRVRLRVRLYGDVSLDATSLRGPDFPVVPGGDDVVLVVDRGLELAVRIENVPESSMPDAAMLVPEGKDAKEATARGHLAQLEQGRLVFTGLRADARYSLLVAPSSEAPDDSLWMSGVRGDAGEIVVRLARGRTIRGHLVVPPGKWEFSVVVPVGVGGVEGEVAEDGRFEIRGVPAGLNRVRGLAHSSDGAQILSGETTSNADEVELTLTPTARPK